MKKELSIVWFRNDLRLHDHEPLTKALAKTDNVLLLYCIDPRHFTKTNFGFQKTGAHRAKFLLESVADLQRNIEKIGGSLIIKFGKPEDIIPQIVTHTQATFVFSSKEVTAEEVNIENLLEERLAKIQVPLTLFGQSTLFHTDDLPFPVGKTPDIYTKFRKEIENIVPVRPLFPTPTHLKKYSYPSDSLPTLADIGIKTPPFDSRACMVFEGGETAGLRRLNEYFWQKDLLKTYKETRNGLIGADYSSKFSPWLSLGCLSPRYIYEQVMLYEQQRVKNESTYWLVFELLWRDYFRCIAKKYGAKIFQAEGIKQQPIVFKKNQKLFDKWASGSTGTPFIDANMRELNATGFMSNRGRQNVASFLVHDLKLNWQLGAAYFEQQLIDYDVCSNWCNWNYIAGVGNDPRENRYFNILKQAQTYDSKGEYVKLWLPELYQALSDNVTCAS
jgi:deoxyribodipyrimidine photo-lyase